MNHSTLKSEIQSVMATTRTERAEANKLIRQGRKLRKLALSEHDAVKKAQLLSEGWGDHGTSVALRHQANMGRSTRRSMHLAAALLNGKTYQQCEQKCVFPPSASYIGKHVAPYLPEADQKNAGTIAEMWVKEGTVRARDLLTQPQEVAA